MGGCPFSGYDHTPRRHDRLSRAQVIDELVRLSYTPEEAERTLDEPDQGKRREIHRQVQERVKRQQQELT